MTPRILPVALLLLPSTVFAGPCLDVGITGRNGGLHWADIEDRLIGTGRLGFVHRVLTFRVLTHDPSFDVLFVMYDGPPLGDGTRPGHEIDGEVYEEWLQRGKSIVMVHGGLAEDLGPSGVFRRDRLPIGGAATCFSLEAYPSFEPPREDPMFHGVEELSWGELTYGFCPTESLSIHPEATIHGYWPHGQVLAASLGPVVAVNVWGSSDDVSSIGYPADSDMPELFVNALYIAAGLDPTTACNGDEDDDGLLDAEEDVLGTDWEDPDTDGDGALDGFDTCPLIADPDQADTDGDGMGNACDEDIDDDGILNPDDNCILWANPEQVDTDGDGTGDLCQGDQDQDGWPDALDNCVDHPNPEQADSDDDGIGDACEPDTDADGVINDVDNCPSVGNADQEDRDYDGIGDACETGCACSATGSSGSVLWMLVVVLGLTVRRRKAM